MTFQDKIQFINMRIEQIFGDGDISDINPIIFTLPGEKTGVTIVTQEMEAYDLCPPIAGSANFYRSDKKQISDLAVVRKIIGYTTIEKMINNPKLIPFQISVVINDGLLEMYKELGLDQNTKRKFFINRPGQGTLFLRDIDNYAGVELRIYSPKLEE